MPCFSRAALVLLTGLAPLPTLAKTSLPPLPAPTGEVVLTVSGALSQTNTPGGAAFDMDMLAALPARSFVTTTTWTDGEKLFSGVPLKTLLETVGASGSTLTATALNDYSVTIPLDSLSDDAPIVAYSIDGAPFPRRDKGPLWIVYPYDADPAYRSEAVYGYSIWQLSTLTLSN
ncbi:molybdopterin-dependent oxidoreductase [Paragemmobacter straminiformis]|uniref:molybdopterin-dependent oxidoreductase n=1 Tax=Paragemmobacter straminiformis TaxID=2045119 RepID=UPI0030CA4415